MNDIYKEKIKGIILKMFRQITEKGLNLIKKWEGLRLRIYRDCVGFSTIGYGHLIQKGENFSDGITELEADKLLKKDLLKVENAVCRLTRVSLTDGMFDALCSFIFNLGSGAYQSSTLRSKLNRGEYEEASMEFPRWCWAGGRKLKGLLLRRLAEKVLFLD